jgi:hypothetical protein
MLCYVLIAKAELRQKVALFEIAESASSSMAASVGNHSNIGNSKTLGLSTTIKQGTLNIILVI